MLSLGGSPHPHPKAASHAARAECTPHGTAPWQGYAPNGVVARRGRRPPAADRLAAGHKRSHATKRAWGEGTPCPGATRARPREGPGETDL